MNPLVINVLSDQFRTVPQSNVVKAGFISCAGIHQLDPRVPTCLVLQLWNPRLFVCRRDDTADDG